HKKRGLILLGLGLVGLGCVLFGLMVQRPSFDRHSYDAIHDGMTMDQVQQVLHGPPGQYFRGTIEFTRPASQGTIRFLGDRLIPEDGCEDVLVGGRDDELHLLQRYIWIGDTYGIGVYFEDGRVVDKEEYEVAGVDDAWLAKVRRWIYQ